MERGTRHSTCGIATPAGTREARRRLPIRRFQCVARFEAWASAPPDCDSVGRSSARPSNRRLRAAIAALSWETAAVESTVPGMRVLALERRHDPSPFSPASSLLRVLGRQVYRSGPVACAVGDADLAQPAAIRHGELVGAHMQLLAQIQRDELRALRLDDVAVLGEHRVLPAPDIGLA